MPSATVPKPVEKVKGLKTEVGRAHIAVLDELVETLKDELSATKTGYTPLEIRDRHEQLYFSHVMRKFPKSSERDSDDQRETVRYLHQRHEVFDNIYGTKEQYVNSITGSDGSRKYVAKDDLPKFESDLMLNALRMWGIDIILDYDKNNRQWR
jgi:hypothetical protein